MDQAPVPAKPNFNSFLIKLLLLLNVATCMFASIQIYKHVNSTLTELTLPFYCTLFLAGNFLFVYGIRALISISQNHSASDNSLPEKIQEAVSGLKFELNEIVLVKKEFNRIKEAINHCTSEIIRLEKELFPSVMQKLNDLNIEANQKNIVVEEQKKTLESQIVALLVAFEGERKQNETDPENQFKLTELINYAEKLITGLKIIYPLSKEDFVPENHSANEIPLGENSLKIDSCKSRGYIFGDKVIKKAEVTLESSGNES